MEVITRLHDVESLRSVEYPSQDAVVRLHEKIIKQSGGHQGFVSISNLAFVLETARDIGEGSPEEEAMVRKAGYLFFNLVNLHPFLDGNKRTAFEVVRNFLNLNRWEFNPSENDAYSTVKKIASGELDSLSTERWVARNLSRGKGGN